jgi:hypothetical protein
MEGESQEKINPENAQDHHDGHRKEEPPEKHPTGGRRGEQKRVGWTVWLLIALMVLLIVSSIANLVVSQRAYESSRKQVTAIEQLTQSIKDIQRSIVNLSNMIEQAPTEEEDPEEIKGSAGDGSI